MLFVKQSLPSWAHPKEHGFWTLKTLSEAIAKPILRRTAWTVRIKGMYPVLDAAHAKAHGAYYTSSEVAHFLVGWAVRNASDHVLDPSFGGGVFLSAAVRRLSELGGMPSQVKGVEVDPAVHAHIGSRLNTAYGTRAENLLNQDFFQVDAESLGSFDAVVGKPPYIRYQRFSGQERALAIERSRQQGVQLSELTSSWAPFLVHSISLVGPGGRLAMVLPMELSHAAYAKPLHGYLRAQFERVSVLSFRQPLFPQLSQDAVLLLAEGRGRPHAGVYYEDLGSAGELANFDPSRMSEAASIERLSSQRISSEAAQLYAHLSSLPQISRLGDEAMVSIGYVSGANGFFNLSPEAAELLRLPPEVLNNALFRGRALRGLTVTAEDWLQASGSRASGYLFSAPEGHNSPEAAAYIALGESQKLHQRYKCRVRRPWHQVPGIQAADGFLTYMSGQSPLLAAAAGRFTASNTLLTVNSRPAANTSVNGLAIGWQSSLARLSAELEGHAMGGGMLKLEPGEARNVLVPNHMENGMITAMDNLFRVGDHAGVRELADQVLIEATGISVSDCKLLADEARDLARQRYFRGKNTK